MDKVFHLDSVEEGVFRYLLARYHEGKHTVDYASLKMDNDLSDPQCETIITLFRELGILSQHYTKPLHVTEKKILLLARELKAPTISTQAPAGDIELERKFMEKAVTEARRSCPEDSRVHPRVGVVVVKDGRELATAYRGELDRGEHAEYTALERKLTDAALAGATVYTTLEPCTTRNHPKIPCAERLIERKVKRVVIGMLDPNGNICGKGVRRLRKSNIIVEFFPHDLMSEIEEMNREFARHHDKIVRPGAEVESEPRETTSGVLSDHDRPTEEITSHQERIAEDIKSHITISTERLVALLKEHNKTNHEELWKRYPFGYVLFGGQGGNLVALPFNRGDIYAEADWKQTQIFLDTQNSIVRVSIPDPIWKRVSSPEAMITISGSVVSQVHYTPGQPVELNAVHIDGQANMYLEVIDDNPRQPICVLGFKK